MPGKYWHGFKVIGHELACLVYFVNKLYDQAHPDEARRPWNDESIVPRSINGSKYDYRCGKPRDWLQPPTSSAREERASTQVNLLGNLCRSLGRVLFPSRCVCPITDPV